ncbi:MAG: bifunctional diguanylate cyclase/phosphohydrolase [Solirubrobacteraceae bacterium]
MLAILFAWMVGDEANALWGGGLSGSFLFGRVAFEAALVTAAVLCLARGFLYARERSVWIAIGGGCMLWCAGDFYFLFVLAPTGGTVSVPSPSDGAFLSFYPLVFAGLVLLYRARSGRTSGAEWLDGLTAALAGAALSAAVALDAVLGSVGGTPLAVATDLAYPVGDLLLMGAIAGALVLCGLRSGRVWWWAALGIALFCVADTLYLVEVAKGTYQVGGWFDIGWPAGMAALAAGAWSQTAERPTPNPRRRRVLAAIALPMVFAALSIGLLLYTGSAHLNWAARILAALSLVVVLVRLARTFRDYAEVSARREREAATDALTGLANRRALNDDLAGVAARVAHGSATVAVFDLDGFKHYNDTFGHHAGDALLTRLSAKLRESVAGHGHAYRMGGDEFCVLLDNGEECVDATIGRAAAALIETGDGFAVRSSFGVTHMPSEASDGESALRLADQRMYDRKAGGRLSAKHQSRDVLLQALCEHATDLGDHTHGVRELAEAVALRLGLDATETDRIGDVAALHDIGKVAIPRAILDKPGRLSTEEWAFMRSHTIIGQRILSAAPALADVAAGVRATHERWDGDGYPDRLAGPAIPLAARVVSVCDAFDAMITKRPYSAARSTAESVAELKRCAGSQFDPAVVEVFEQVLSARSVSPTQLSATHRDAVVLAAQPAAEVVSTP